ncbi:MAG: hypothetical protein ACI957_005357 [Verrucomicrobiales bacterium]|jgi:hypothetical protein
MDEHQVEVKSKVDAKKETIVANEGIKLALKADRVVAAKGKKIVEFALSGRKLQDGATEDDLRKAIIGPSGNLRAPAIWIDDALVVGFLADMYEMVLA